MFYSQFILAKKGPLGTIWIAAHLERKLRKNQVADTDIGISVDSILSPDVPIALRLSSHLLLGVVRIYSRKVNYLFHDCSEALLKVKQAFRSTAVDLPPEESTAPYHSITLPETFDLDDFELPDSEYFQGNYVDHHVSTREQITLQDTMDGVVYSTSQFGLDERFGDGDASQIGLDLDEELFLEKVSSSRNTAVLVEIDDVDPQASGQAMTPFPDMDIEDEENKYDEDRTAEAPDVNLTGCSGEQIDSNLHDQKIADERSNDYIVSSSDFHSADENKEVESSAKNKTFESDGLPSAENGSLSDDLQVVQDKQQEDIPSTTVAMDPATSDLASMLSPTSVLAEQVKPVSPVSECLDRTLASSDSIERAEASHDGNASPRLPNVSSLNQTHAEGVEPYVTSSPCTLEESPKKCEAVDVNTDLDCQPISEGMMKGDCVVHEKSVPEASVDLVNEGGIDLHELKNDGKACTETENAEEHSQNFMLHPCNSLQTQSLEEEDKSERGQDSPSERVEPSPSQTVGSNDILQASGKSSVLEGDQSIGDSETILKADNLTGTIISDAVEVDFTKSNELLDADVSKDNHTELDCPASSDLPAPEILLSAPEAVPDVPGDLLVEPSHGKDVSTGLEGNSDGLTVYKRKRRVTETTPILPDENTTNLSGETQPKRILDSVPDDDDLLTSILVGRKSSILKMKPTPQPEIPPSKRRRVASRASASKRKVLLDDTMVLHGDTIRQQLTSTEDIRRMRRKAPCTRSEIWIIQQNLLEDDIFNEPPFTGMIADLIDLHNGTFDISEVRVSNINATNTVMKEADVNEISISTDIIEEVHVEGTSEPVVVEQEPVVVEHDGFTHEPAETTPLQTENQLHVDHLTNSVACESHEMGEPATEVTPLEFTNDDKLGEASTMEVEETGNGEILMQELNKEELLVAEGASIEKEDSCLQECENGGLIEVVPPNIPQEDQINMEEGSSTLVNTTLLIDSSLENGIYVATDASDPVNCENPPSDNVSTHLSVETNDHGKDEIKDSELEPLRENENMTEIVKDDGGNYEESERDSLCPLENNGNVANIHLDEGENTGNQEANLDTDFGNTMGEHDTEFLNFDDDEVADEEEDNGMPSTDEARLLENSGWSSRTRAVAKYMQTLFDKETGQGKKGIPVNNLLSGKTKKEASRMFFETLVLKTRDYIHVEQENPFGNINVKPRAKLMKSDF